MKAAVSGILLLVVIQLATVALAADQVVEKHGGESCSWEDVVRSCQEFHMDGELCCHTLATASEGGCFFSELAPVIETLGSLPRDVCQLEIIPLGSAQSSESDITNVRFLSPVHRSTRPRGLRKLIQGQVPLPAQPETSAEEIHNNNVADEEETSGEGYPRVMAASFFGSLLLSCAVVCPCFMAKKRDELRDPFQKDSSKSQSIPSISTMEGGSSHVGSHLAAHPLGGALVFTMAELQKVTGNFSLSHKIGQGGFGTVYKGRLRDGTLVAVKRAKKDASEARLSMEFQNELDMLSQVDHLNLVKLIGYLEEEHERIIVVEYVPNGNLREHLDGLYGDALDTHTRLDIAIDVAHALTYLHSYADHPIIHRDVKASNILLTDSCRAKVADFGFSRAGPTDKGATHVSTQVKGTAGYLDPEYLTTYQLNEKSDVYSFGIVLIELFTGRRPIEMRRQRDERITVRWAFKKFMEGKVVETLDPRLERTPATSTMMERLAELAFACVAPTKIDRPSMKKATEALWKIRKDYLGQATAGSPSSYSSYATPSLSGIPSRASPMVISPPNGSGTPSMPSTPLPRSPGHSNGR